MFDFVLKLFGGKSETEKLQELVDVVASLEVASEDEEPTDNDILEGIKKIQENHQCFKKTGIITAINEENGYIDKLFFDRQTAARKIAVLEKGMKVAYLAYKLSDDIPIKIVEIEEVISYWDKDEDEKVCLYDVKDEYFNHHKKSVSTKIIDKNKNYVTVSQEDFLINLDEVSCDFVPYVNDFITILCYVQTNTEYFDMSGQILNVISIRATRIITRKGQIQSIRGNMGIIEDEFIYYNEALETNYKPEVGDLVCFDAIEHDADPYIYRCIKVALIEKEYKADRKHSYTEKIEPVVERTDNGIVYTKTLHFDANALDVILEKNIDITNESEEIYKIISFKLLNKKLINQIEIMEPNASEIVVLRPSETFSLTVKFKSIFSGTLIHKIEIMFEGDFAIICDVEIEVEYAEKKVPEYRNFRKSHNTYRTINNKNYLPGVRPNKKPNFIFENIDAYKIPEGLYAKILNHDTFDAMNAAIDEHMPDLGMRLNWKMYKTIFHGLIHLEDMHMFHLFRKLDMNRVHFKKKDQYLTLTIENLAECRPSLAIGDSANITSIVDPTATSLEGFIHKITKDDVHLQFHRDFHNRYNGEDYSIVFKYSRTTIRKMHHAIDKATINLGESFFFPSKVLIQHPVKLDIILNENLELVRENFTCVYPWFNKDLNVYQKEAVKNVLRGETRPLPYVIFGPPGTGKTMTVIEIILQIITLNPDSRIIVATPSNSAANLITEKLMYSGVLELGEFMRVVSFNLIEKELIPDHIAPHCVHIDTALERTTMNETIVTKSGLKMKCQSNEVGRSKVNIGTCATLGTFFWMNLSKNHFTHVIIDEAGQCLEPEALIPISFISQNMGQVVLAGDPMQLDPIVMSKHASERGLNVSFLERLLEQFPYQKDSARFENGYDPRFVTQLRYNYRAIPSILNVYSELFYDSILVPQVNDVDSAKIKLLYSLQSILPNPTTRNEKCGIFFVSVFGKSLQNKESPSWYNNQEAKAVFKFIVKLYGQNVKPDKIGVITPYQKQVKVIRNIIEQSNLIVPKVGSVEEFQGQERDIILISTVRSAAKEMLDIDKKYALGFVSEPKRLNVAISRATSLVVIFGHPNVLSVDLKWRRVIKITEENNTFVK